MLCQVSQNWSSDLTQFHSKSPKRFFFFCRGWGGGLQNHNKLILKFIHKNKGPSEEVIFISRNQMAHKNMKRCSISLVLKEMQIKTTIRYSTNGIRWEKIKNKTLTMPVFKVWKNKDIQKLLVKIKAGEITLETRLSSKVDWESILPLTPSSQLATEVFKLLGLWTPFTLGLYIPSKATD